MELAMQLDSHLSDEWLADFPAALRRGTERGLRRATELLERAVMANAQTPLGAKSDAALGQLARSVTSELYEEEGRSFGQVFLAPPADRYGLFVEVGTRPHFPPPAALEGWVRQRLGVTNDRQARRIAFLIGRKIARRGTPGHFLFERALKENEARVVAVLEEEIDKALA